MKDILARLQSMLGKLGWCELNSKKTGWNFIGIDSSLLDTIEAHVADVQLELDKQPKAWTVKFNPSTTIEDEKIVNKQVVTTSRELKPMINVFPTPVGKSSASDDDMLSVV